MEDKKSILLPKLGGVVIKYLLFGVLSFLIRGLIQFGANELLGEGSFEDVTIEIFALILVILSFTMDILIGGNYETKRDINKDTF